MSFPQSVFNAVRDSAREKRNEARVLFQKIDGMEKALAETKQQREGLIEVACVLADFLQSHELPGKDWRAEFQLPPFVPAWPDPQEGYRLLVTGEITQSGDEYVDASFRWKPVPNVLLNVPQGKPQTVSGGLGSFPVRRKFRTEAV